MIIATAGHVDHGKTSLVRALTGVETDRLAEEKRRGLTIEPGFAYTDHEGQRWGFVDCPGHHRFISNMLSGVSGIDAALLVVAADDGVMPQTVEHAQILDLLDVRRCILAITKSDLADAERIREVTRSATDLVAPTSMEVAATLSVSAQTGDGIRDLATALSVIEREQAARSLGDRFRMAVDRTFTVQGAGLVVTGTALCGAVRRGDVLQIAPGGGEARVRGIRALDEETDQGGGGQRLALNLTGPDVDSITRGGWMLAPELPGVVQRFDASIRCVDGVALRNGMETWLHHGARRVGARLTLLESGTPETPLVHVSTQEPVSVLHGDRFVLRDSAGQATLAGGRVLDIEPPSRGRTKPDRLALLRALDRSDASLAMADLLQLQPWEFDLGKWARKLNRRAESLLAALEQATDATPPVVERGSNLILRDATRWAGLQEEITDALARFHQASPQLAGMNEAELAPLLAPMRNREIRRAQLDAALAQLVQGGRVQRTATRYRLPDHRPAMAPQDARIWSKIRPLLAEDVVKPPVVHDLCKRIQADPKSTADLLGRVHHAGEVVRVAENRFMLPAGVARLAHTAERVAAAAAEGLFDVRAFRDASGTGRNLAIDMLEFFDRQGLTRRRDDVRFIVGSAEALYGPDA